MGAGAGGAVWRRRSVRGGFSLANLSAAYTGKAYSPYAERNFPERPLWGDSHLHTSLSVDAGLFGNTLPPRDAAAAQAAWTAWRNTQPAAFDPGPALRAALVAMQRRLFGAAPAGRWQGDELARAFRAHVTAVKPRAPGGPASALPELNPRGGTSAGPQRATTADGGPTGGSRA